MLKSGADSLSNDQRMEVVYRNEDDDDDNGLRPFCPACLQLVSGDFSLLLSTNASWLVRCRH